MMRASYEWIFNPSGGGSRLYTVLSALNGPSSSISGEASWHNWHGWWDRYLPTLGPWVANGHSIPRRPGKALKTRFWSFKVRLNNRYSGSGADRQNDITRRRHGIISGRAGAPLEYPLRGPSGIASYNCLPTYQFPFHSPTYSFYIFKWSLLRSLRSKKSLIAIHVLEFKMLHGINWKIHKIINSRTSECYVTLGPICLPSQKIWTNVNQ